MPGLVSTPVQLTAAQMRAIANAIYRQAQVLSMEKLATVMDEIEATLKNLLNPQLVDRGREFPVTEGVNPATARSELTRMLKQNNLEELVPSLDFTIETATDVAQGAGTYVRNNQPEVVDAWPALEFRRLFAREVPRGMKKKKGVLVPDPDQDWPTRWTAAAEESGDVDAQRILEETGRMIALKASPIWKSLGDGAGGYKDTLHNPFEPFAFNSGFSVKNISLLESQKLGLIKPGAKPRPADIDLSKLFSLPKAA